MRLLAPSHVTRTRSAEGPRATSSVWTRSSPRNNSTRSMGPVPMTLTETVGGSLVAYSAPMRWPSAETAATMRTPEVAYTRRAFIAAVTASRLRSEAYRPVSPAFW